MGKIENQRKNKIIKIVFAIAIILLIILGIILRGRSLINNDENKNRNEDVNIIYNNLKDALNGYYERIDKTTESGEKEKLLEELENYVINDINGYYYHYGTYNHLVTGSGYAYSKSEDVKDFRTIYIKDKDEVYIVPFSKQELEEKNINLENIETLDTNGIYKYKIIELKTSNKDGSYNASKSAKIKFQSYKVDENADSRFKNVEISYYTSDDKYNISGFFADLSEVEYDYSREMALKVQLKEYRDYYRDEEKSIAVEQNEKIEENIKEQEKQRIKNSIPQVGMSPSEVKQTKWGSPDRINKDTYSWGTTEQWVYNNYGYVYFRNGVVSSVSQR